MKTIINIAIVVIIFYSSVLGYGGSPPPVVPPFYNAKTSDALFQPPLNLGEAGKTVLLFQFNYTTVPDISGRIDLQGTGTEPAGLENGKNFKWDIPSVNFKMGLYPALSQNSSLLLLLKGKTVGGNMQLNGADIGLSFNISRSENHYARLGFGVDLHDNHFFWVQSLNTPAKECTNFEYDPFLLFSYNTDFKDWLFNPFLEISYCKQTLIDDKDYSNEDYDQEVYFNIDVFTFTPGLSYKLGHRINISYGIMLYYYEGIENSHKFLFSPFIQMGLSL